MKTFAFAVLSQVFITLSAHSHTEDLIESLHIDRIPVRSLYALNGDDFAYTIQNLSGTAREDAIIEQALSGNMPSFQRLLVPISVEKRIFDGSKVRLTYYVMPDYLAIGSDANYIRVPINLYSAQQIAQALGFVLPTRKMVNQIYHKAELKLHPRPMKPGPQMTSTRYFIRHNAMIDAQLKKIQEFPGQLVAGHKKDVVQSRKLLSKPSAIAIYGWHRSYQNPIQPLSTVHGAYYADYSHGIRLVSQWAVMEHRGSRKIITIGEVLDSSLWSLISDEGRVREPQLLLSRSNG